MNKAEFLDYLASRLHMLPQKEIEKSLGYYAEMIDDRMEDGMTEEEAVAALGDMDEIVNAVMMETPLPTLIKSKIKSKPGDRQWWKILLIVLGAPLWLPVVFSFFAAILSVYVCIWSAIISLYSGVLALLAGGAAGILGSGFVFSWNLSTGFFILGSGIFCVGAGIFALFGVNKLSVWLIRLTGLFVRKVKGLFVKKEGSK